MIKTTPISVKSNLASVRLYPAPNTDRSMETLRTAESVFATELAVRLAKRHLPANEAWDNISVIRFRIRPLASDGRFVITGSLLR